MHPAAVMRYLIDGYNLLYAIGRLTPRSGKSALQASRQWLLVELGRWHGQGSADVIVVFDARNAPGGVHSESEHGGIRVLFARGQTADDLIEEMLGGETNPRQLSVVSDDHRLKDAARRRGCTALGCLDYAVSWQEARPTPVEVVPEAGKPDSLSDEEKREWLEVFGDIDGG